MTMPLDTFTTPSTSTACFAKCTTPSILSHTSQSYWVSLVPGSFTIWVWWLLSNALFWLTCSQHSQWC
jgi:hypothetical protein